MARKFFGQIFVVLCATAASVAAQQADNLSREQLKPLTEFRQQHRRLVQRGYSLIQEVACVAWFARSMAGGWPVMQCSVRAGHWMFPFACNYTGWILFVFSQKFGRSPAFTPVAPTWQPETCSRLLCLGACDVFSLAALLSIGP